MGGGILSSPSRAGRGAGAVRAGAVGWGAARDYSALRKEGWGKRAAPRGPRFLLAAPSRRRRGWGAPHGWLVSGARAAGGFALLWRARRRAWLAVYPSRGPQLRGWGGPPPAALNNQLRTGADKGNPTV
jgi:hypothetical protein